MQGVRGYNKAPGNYRRLPDTCWIGPPGSTIETARYIPCPVEELRSAMDMLESYLHEEPPDSLVQLAIVHAEFEAIHPFLDGNGRMGRLIVPLFMFTKQLLSSPSLYISEYLESHREEYYDGLLAVSRDGDWTGWCVFFLTAVTEQARTYQEKVHELLALYDDRKEQIVEATRSQYSGKILDWIFARPIFQTTDFVKNSDIPEPSARHILRVLKDQGLLKEIVKSRGRQPATIAFVDLLNIVEGRRLF